MKIVLACVWLLDEVQFSLKDRMKRHAQDSFFKSRWTSKNENLSSSEHERWDTQQLKTRRRNEACHLHMWWPFPPWLWKAVRMADDLHAAITHVVWEVLPSTGAVFSMALCDMSHWPPHPTADVESCLHYWSSLIQQDLRMNFIDFNS